LWAAAEGWLRLSLKSEQNPLSESSRDEL
jgi:hypothetical protein